jgi:hypothetical protein
VGRRPVKTLTWLEVSAANLAGSKTQPRYWLATDNDTRRSQKTERHNRIDKTTEKNSRDKQRPSELTRSTRLYTESFGILQMLKLQT